LAGGLGGPRIRQDGDAHADVTGGKRTKGANHETEGGEFVPKDKEQDENDRGDGADRDDLSFQISFRAFFDRAGNLAHPVISWGESDDRFDKKEGAKQAQHGENHRKGDTGFENIEGEKSHDGSVESGGL
jgi:hypothetical protein